MVLERADNAFVAGNYPEAADLYEHYLLLAPDGDQRDQALFRMAMASTGPEASDQSWSRATTALQRLIDENPESPLKAPASLILALRSEAARLKTDTVGLSAEISRLNAEIAGLTAKISGLTADLASLTLELSSVNTDTERREGRIRELSTEVERLTREIERLKQIDAERARRP